MGRIRPFPSKRRMSCETAHPTPKQWLIATAVLPIRFVTESLLPFTARSRPRLQPPEKPQQQKQNEDTFNHAVPPRKKEQTPRKASALWLARSGQSRPRMGYRLLPGLECRFHNRRYRFGCHYHHDCSRNGLNQPASRTKHARCHPGLSTNVGHRCCDLV